MPSLALCMMVKNEAKNLARCINSVKKIVDEIVIVDTGSTDSTSEIARQLGARVYHFKWVDDYSAARNFSFGKVQSDWILLLDADETIAEKDMEKLRGLIEQEGLDENILAFDLIQRNYTNAAGQRGWVSSKDDAYEESRNAYGFCPRLMTRLFRNDKRILATDPAHDSVKPAILKIGRVVETDIPIHHFGKENIEKTRNYISLAKKQFKDNFFQAYQIGAQLHEINELDEAVSWLEKSVKLNPLFFLPYLELGIIYLKKNNITKAKEMLEKASSYAEDESVYNHLGIVYAELKDFDRAISNFKKAVSLNYKNADIHFNLGLTYHNIGNINEAKREFSIAITLNPSYKEKVRFK